MNRAQVFLLTASFVFLSKPPPHITFLFFPTSSMAGLAPFCRAVLGVAREGREEITVGLLFLQVIERKRWRRRRQQWRRRRMVTKRTLRGRERSPRRQSAKDVDEVSKNCCVCLELC